MAPIALSNKKILACRDLYFIDSHQSNLAGYVIGTIISLPRNGRTSYLVQWDEDSLNSTVPQNQRHLVQSSIEKSDSTYALIVQARTRFENSVPNVSENTDQSETTHDQTITDSQRLVQVQRLLTSPTQRRRGYPRDSNDSFDSDSSESDSDDEDLIVDTFNEMSYVSDGESDEDNDPPEESNGVLDSLFWKFDIKDCSDESLRLHEHKRTIYAEKTKLKTGVSASFTTPLEAFQVVGGFDYDCVKRLCRNSNDYIRRVIIPARTDGLLYGQIFVDISVEEMMKFLGIVLRISLNPLDYGGYEAYFNPSGIEIEINENKVMKAEGTGGWAVKYMSLKRFKIIRKAFHPEDRSARQCGDKCFHLRHLIRQFKSAAMNSFIPGRDIAFDEGGVGSRHRLNPVRMFNQNKPQKFRVDFFICSVTEPDRYVIMHLDIYQGANAHNIDIHPEALCLGTTMKAVVNAVRQLGLDNDPHGSRIMALDNRYVIILFLISIEKYLIYYCYVKGICALNWQFF